MKCRQIPRGEINLSLYADAIVVYVENRKALRRKKYSELSSEFSQVAGFKINIQTVVLLYHNHEHMATEMKNIILKRRNS